MRTRLSAYSALRYTLFVYMVCVVLLITLMPFNFDFYIPRRVPFVWHGDMLDILSNIFLFVPLGFLYRICFREGRGRLCLQELMLGLLMSLAIEALQIFLPSRKPTVADVLTNGAGVWLGAQLDVLVMSRLNRDHLVRLFALELPLMALICFLTPLLWISAYTTHIYPNRLVLILLLGLFGTGIWHSIFVHRLRPRGHLSEKKMILIAAAWFFISSVPGLINIPWLVMAIGVLVMIALVFQIRWQMVWQRRWPGKPADRRFEVATLKKYLPLYAAYLLLLMLWPPKPEISSWGFGVGFSAYFYGKPMFIKFRFMEYVGAFTVMGYVVAELRSRKQETARESRCRFCAGVLICTTAITVLRGFHPYYTASLAEWAWFTGFGLFGGWIYRLRRDAVRRFCAENYARSGEVLKDVCE